MKQPKVLITVLVFLCVGLGLLVGGVVWYFNTSAFLESAKSTSGEVVDLIREESTRRRDGRRVREVSYYPVISFEDGAGDTHEFKASQGSNPPSYSDGDSVDVLYDPDNPKSASINSFFSLWGGPLILSAMGLFFTMFGGFGIYQYLVKGEIKMRSSRTV